MGAIVDMNAHKVVVNSWTDRASCRVRNAEPGLDEKSIGKSAHTEAAIITQPDGASFK